MRQLLGIALSGITLVVVIRLAVCFPRSLLARVLFLPHGPVPIRGESKAAFHFRCARFHAGWLAQSALVFVAGRVALRLDASLCDSLVFLVLFGAVAPALAAGALASALVAVGRGMRARRAATSGT